MLNRYEINSYCKPHELNNFRHVRVYINSNSHNHLNVFKMHIEHNKSFKIKPFPSDYPHLSNLA